MLAVMFVRAYELAHVPQLADSGVQDLSGRIVISLSFTCSQAKEPAKSRQPDKQLKQVLTQLILDQAAMTTAMTTDYSFESCLSMAPELRCT